MAHLPGLVVLLKLALLLFASPGVAQSLDDCMQNQGQRAITICQQLLDGGSRNPTVFYKLASEHYQNNNNKTALNLIERGLALHPNDGNLKRLQDYVTIGSREDRDLEKSAEKNQRRIKLGQLKITCRTKSGSVGTSACKEYLSLTNADKDVIEKRLAALGGGNSSARVSSNAEPGNAEPGNARSNAQATQSQTTISQTGTSTGKSTSDSTISANNNLSTTQRTRRETVAQVQSALNNLGFDAGTADGISGAKTRRALASFYRDSKLPASTTIDQSTLDLIENAVSLKSLATSTFEKSMAARNAGDITTALQRLDEAQATSPLLTVSAGYRKELLAMQNVAVVETTRPAAQVEAPRQAPTPKAADKVDNAEVNALIAQLQSMEFKLQSHDTAMRKSLGEIRAIGQVD